MVSPAPPRSFASDADLLRDTGNHLYAFEAGDALFVPMDRAAYARSAFLDRRISPAAEGVLRRPITALLAALPAVPMTPPAWIFHMAHGGSTLLARALDDGTGALVLREPLALRQLGVAAAWGDAGLEEPLALLTALYGRRQPLGVATLVKANVPVNFLLAPLLAAGTPAILLYQPLAAYLTAVLHSDANRNWVRFVTDELQPGITAMAGPFDGASDAERAAALWLAQIRLFADALNRHPAAMSLAADTLFNQPTEALTAAARHVGRPHDPAHIAGIVAGPVFNTYSKNPAIAFDNAMRQQRQADTARALAGALDEARRWITARRDRFPFPDQLARPLAGVSPPLLC